MHDLDDRFERLDRRLSEIERRVSALERPVATGESVPTVDTEPEWRVHAEALPLSGAGKILKTELRKPFWEGREKQVN